MIFYARGGHYMKDINLMLEEDRRNASAADTVKRRNGINSKVLVWAVISVIFVILTLIAPSMIVKALEAQSETLKGELTAKKYQDVITAKNNINQINSTIAAKQNIIKLIDKENKSISPLINNISHAAPKNCYITSFTYKDQSLNIGGISMDGSLRAAEFMANLDRLNAISSNGITNTINMTKSDEVCTFQFTYKLNGKGAN